MTSRAATGSAPRDLSESRYEGTTSTAPPPGLQLHRVSIVIPALNEALNLGHVLPLIPDWVHEVILVDGSSIDGTVEAARDLWPEILVVAQEGTGKGSALRTGLSAATGEIIVMLDADGSMNPREIPAFVEALLAGADFVKGSRFLPGGGTEDMPLYRKLGNAAFVSAVRMLFGGRFTDLCYGYTACWAGALPRLQLDASGFEIETQMSLRALWAGLRIREVPSFEAHRVYGSSNLRTVPDGWRVLKEICRERFRSPIARGSAAVIDSVGIPPMPETFETEHGAVGTPPLLRLEVLRPRPNAVVSSSVPKG